MTGPRVSVLEVLGRSAGGIARHVAELTESLDASDEIGIEIAAPADLPVAMPKSVHAVAIPDGPFGHRAAVSRLRRIIRSTDADVVHAHGLRAGIDACLAARGFGAPVLLTVHNLVRPQVAGRLKAPLYGWAEVVATRLSDHVFCVSEDIARHLRLRVPSAAARMEVLYLGVRSPPTPRRSKQEVRRDLDVADAPLVVTASRLAPQKAVHVMLEALTRVEGARLAVLGEGALEAELKARAEALKLGERVIWLGFRDDATDVIAAADVFCLSSVWEGVPLAAQEAILLGIPIVATAVGGMEELLTDGHSGRLVDPGDVQALSGALQETLASPDSARRHAEMARKELLERFSTERMLKRVRAAYEEGAGITK
jgi:glycosyltransferase involved in cell wall biosynthesis